MTDAGEELRRAIAAAAGCQVAVESRAWASVTFSGARHEIRLSLADPEAADAFLEGLAEREFALRGHVVADIVPIRDERDGSGVRLVLEALTVEED